MDNKISTLSRALVLDNQMSLAVLDTTALVGEAAKRHRLKEGSLQVLGNTLTASAYLCSWLKGPNSSLAISLHTDGDFGKVSVLGDGNLNLRGYVENTAVEQGKLGDGTLSVVRDDRTGLPFVGTVPLVSEQIDENFAAYFSESEQIHTGVALCVLTGGGKPVRAGGVILQALPFADESVRLQIPSKTALLKEFLMAGELDKIWGEFGVQKTETREVKFACTCSKARVESLLLSMGKEQATALCEEDGQISVHCEYCNTDYIFLQDKVRELFKKHE